MKKYIFIAILSVLMFFCGSMFTIYNIKIDTIILQNAEGSTTVCIEFMGQYWNYKTQNGTLESVNN